MLTDMTHQAPNRMARLMLTPAERLPVNDTSTPLLPAHHRMTQELCAVSPIEKMSVQKAFLITLVRRPAFEEQ